MSEKISTSKRKQQVTRVFNQAKESLKLLGTLEKEALAKARTFVNLPHIYDSKFLNNKKILGGLKKLGIATQSEVDELQLKVEKLELLLQAKSNLDTAPSASNPATPSGN